MPLTHGSNFQLLTGASITCAAGDRFRIRYFGSSVWKMVSFQRASGQALAVATVPSFSANKNGSDQSISNGVYTKITFGTEDWDVGGYYDAANSKWTPPAGKYLITVSMNISGLTGIAHATLYKNGSAHRDLTFTAIGGNWACSLLIDANGSDYFEVYAEQTGGGSHTIGGDTILTFFQGVKVG